jgi:hypothetical protein
MRTALPPWQLTTSELEREIRSLEASPDAGEADRSRLAALHVERDGRKLLAARLMTAGQQFPDDEPW